MDDQYIRISLESYRALMKLAIARRDADLSCTLEAAIAAYDRAQQAKAIVSGFDPQACDQPRLKPSLFPLGGK